MPVCVYVCMCVCVYVCMCVCVYVCMCVCVYVCMCVCVYVCMCVCVYVCMCVRARACVRACVRAYTRIHLGLIAELEDARPTETAHAMLNPGHHIHRVEVFLVYVLFTDGAFEGGYNRPHPVTVESRAVHIRSTRPEPVLLRPTSLHQTTVNNQFTDCSSHPEPRLQAQRTAVGESGCTLTLVPAPVSTLAHLGAILLQLAPGTPELRLLDTITMPADVHCNDVYTMCVVY